MLPSPNSNTNCMQRRPQVLILEAPKKTSLCVLQVYQIFRRLLLFCYNLIAYSIYNIYIILLLFVHSRSTKYAEGHFFCLFTSYYLLLVILFSYYAYLIYMCKILFERFCGDASSRRARRLLVVILACHTRQHRISQMDNN